MDKNTFMRELERSLSVLQESELRDILSEYEQHIDMKVKSGLSEEEAIADFGSIPELTAEILEAYHVRADFGPGQRDGDGWRAAEDGQNDGDGSSEDQGDGEKERRAAETWKARAAGFFSELGRRAVKLARRAGRWVSDVFVFWRELLGRPFRRFSRFWKQRREEQLYLTDGSMEMENAGKKRGNAGVSLGSTAGSFGRRLAGMAKRCFNSLIRLTVWTARLFWNGHLDLSGRLYGRYRTYVFIRSWSSGRADGPGISGGRSDSGLSGSDGEPVFCRRSGHDPSVEKEEKMTGSRFPMGEWGSQGDRSRA